MYIYMSGRPYGYGPVGTGIGTVIGRPMGQQVRVQYKTMGTGLSM